MCTILFFGVRKMLNYKKCGKLQTRLDELNLFCLKTEQHQFIVNTPL